MEQGRTGEAYNVGSGTLTTVNEVLQRLIALTGVQVEIKADPSRFRRADAAACLDAGKLRRETGWAPRHSLDETLRDTLGYRRPSPPSGGAVV